MCANLDPSGETAWGREHEVAMFSTFPSYRTGVEAVASTGAWLSMISALENLLGTSSIYLLLCAGPQ